MVVAYSAIASWGLWKAVAVVTLIRVSTGDEGLGLDVSQHGEEAYVRGEGALLILRDALPSPRAAAASSSVGVALKNRGGPVVKLVVAIVRPDKLSDVVEALFRADVRGLTLARVQATPARPNRCLFFPPKKTE